MNRRESKIVHENQLREGAFWRSRRMKSLMGGLAAEWAPASWAFESGQMAFRFLEPAAVAQTFNQHKCHQGTKRQDNAMPKQSRL